MAERPAVADRRGGRARATAGRLRGLLLGLILLGMAGLAAELVLLGHTEDRLQWIPLVLLAAGLVVAAAAAVRPARSTLHALRVVMLAFVVAGALGVFLHYRGNVEFELEMYPELRGFALFREAMTGATPALAPGALAQLGLLGMIFTYRHPALAPRAAAPDTREEDAT